MPILAREQDIYPDNLLDIAGSPSDDRCWWALYTLSRREKELMRQLLAQKLPFYGPLIPKRTKSPAGRIRTAYLPLFTNYVFLFGNGEERVEAQKSNCISRYLEVVDNSELIRDLKQFRELIALDVPLTPESRLQPGQRVRIRSGRFRGFEGTIIRREREVRLLVAVNFIQQGASLLLEDCEVEAI